MALLDRTHPMLRGCRLLYLPGYGAGGPGAHRNRVGPGGLPGTSSGVSLVPARGGRLSLAGAAGNGLVYADSSVYPRATTAEKTVVAKLRITGTNGIAGNVQGIYSDAETGLASGCNLFFCKDTYSNTGFNFAIYSGGHYYIANGQGQFLGYDVDRVVAGVFWRPENTVDVYVDGLFRGTNKFSDLGTPTAQTWTLWGAGNATVGHYPLGTTEAFKGELEWLALFDVGLRLPAIREWGRGPQHWPFLRDTPLAVLASGGTYTNLLRVGHSAGVGSAGETRDYANALDAEAYVGGDLAGGSGGGAGTVTYRGGVRAAHAATLGTPQLVHYANVAGVRGSPTSAPVVTYRNRLGARQAGRTNLDGRRDLLNTTRYRR